MDVVLYSTLYVRDCRGEVPLTDVSHMDPETRKKIAVNNPPERLSWALATQDSIDVQSLQINAEFGHQPSGKRR
jgi:hypothetical protein